MSKEPLPPIKTGSIEDAAEDANYKRILKMEVLGEFASSINACFFRYMERNNIDPEDTTNIIVMLENDAFLSKNDLYGGKTFEELLLVEGRLRYLDSVIKRLQGIEAANV